MTYRVYRIKCVRRSRGIDEFSLGAYSRDQAIAWLRKALGDDLLRIL